MPTAARLKPEYAQILVSAFETVELQREMASQPARSVEWMAVEPPPEERSEALEPEEPPLEGACRSAGKMRSHWALARRRRHIAGLPAERAGRSQEGAFPVVVLESQAWIELVARDLALESLRLHSRRWALLAPARAQLVAEFHIGDKTACSERLKPHIWYRLGLACLAWLARRQL